MDHTLAGQERKELLTVRRPVADLFERFYPNYHGENAAFKRQALSGLLPSHVVLDAGCGNGHMSDLDVKARSKRVIGVDVCDDLKANDSVHHAISGILESLPLRDGSVDLLLCRYVAEHLPDPSKVFREFARVLREGGKVVLLTPNQWHYVSLISRFSPFGFHRWFNSLYGVAEEDTFPTFYRANSRGRIRKLAKGSGLRVVTLRMLETSPNYLEFSRILYRLGIAYERLVNRWSALAPWRVNIIATLEKPVTRGADGVGRSRKELQLEDVPA
jgi:SAM-dependent methyltransferase